MEQSATVLADPDAMQKINRAYDELGTVYKNQQIKNLNPSDKRISTGNIYRKHLGNLCRNESKNRRSLYQCRHNTGRNQRNSRYPVSRKAVTEV